MSSVSEEAYVEDAFVRVEGVTKAFGAGVGVNDVTFSIRRGEFVTLLGPSGSGKTTVLRMVAGLTPPDCGNIVINGRDIESVPAYRRSIGVVFQSLALFPNMNVRENVAYPLRCRRYDRREIPHLVQHYLEVVKIGALGDRRIGELSGGQRQRVAIARALVFKPDLLLLDEPLAALDTKLREEVQMEFRRIQAELGVTTINVTHDQREALVMSDAVVVMNRGRVQQSGSPKEVYLRPSNAFVAGFIGHNNVFGASRADIGRSLSVSTAARIESSVSSGVGCSIRAERIVIASDAAALAGMDVVFAARIKTVAFEGDRILYHVKADTFSSVLQVIDRNLIPSYASGTPVVLGWRIADMAEWECG